MCVCFDLRSLFKIIKIIVAYHRQNRKDDWFDNLRQLQKIVLNLCWQSRKLSCVRFIFCTAISNLASLDAQQLPIYLPSLHSNYKITFRVARRYTRHLRMSLERVCLCSIYRSSLRHSHRNVGRRATMRSGKINYVLLGCSSQTENGVFRWIDWSGRLIRACKIANSLNSTYIEVHLIRHVVLA